MVGGFVVDDRTAMETENGSGDDGKLAATVASTGDDLYEMSVSSLSKCLNR